MPRPAATTTVIEIHKSPDSTQRLRMTWLRDHLKLVVKKIKHPLARVAISLIDDAGMTALHREHLRINSTTDVLTFQNTAPGEAIDVDIAVCVDEAARQAGAHDHSIEQEILLYILHGMLHCCGFNDRTKAGYAKMHAEEDRILRLIGVGATFARPAPRTRKRRRTRTAR